MTNDLIKSTINYSDPAMLETLRNTVAVGATPAEFAMFTEFCKGTGLNPFKREIWFVKAGGRVQMMTGLNGFLAIANAHPEYDGMEVEVDNDEKPTKATCKVWRKDRKFPSVGVALMREYGKGSPIWQQMPRVMLTKVAKSIAIREAFPQELNGLYTQEEMPAEFSAEAVQQRREHVEVTERKVAEAVETTAGKMIFTYNLTELPVEKHDAACELLEANKAVMISVDEWESPVTIDKLKKYLKSSEIRN